MRKLDKSSVGHFRQFALWLPMVMATTSCRFDLPPTFSADAVGSDGTPRPPQFTSCMGLPTICGASATASCCELAEAVSGGTFLRGYDEATDDFNDVNYPATVSAFVLDKYEVTVGRFRAFVNAGLGIQLSSPAEGAGAHLKLVGSGWDSAWNARLVSNTGALISALKCEPTWQTWTDAPGTNENKPMGCVTWYEAMAFCIWDGGYLPTEAEWNYAAAGGDQQRTYPWSNPASSTTIDCTYANYRIDAPSGMFCVNGLTGAMNRVGSESPKGDSRWGHSDLAGNAWEWTLDSHAAAYPLPCSDCADLTPSSLRVLRGFSFFQSSARTALRSSFIETGRDPAVGLRCARSP